MSRSRLSPQCMRQSGHWAELAVPGLRKIAVITVARSDYGIYRPILRRIVASRSLQLHLVVTGMHLSPAFGLTVTEIETDGFAIAARVPCHVDGDTPLATAQSMGIEIHGIAEAIEGIRPDVLMVLGDRFEMLAAALAALPFNCVIAHVHGGELSFGAIDDAMRHAISKMSHLHFVSTAEAARRLEQMGEEWHRIVVSGAPSLDNIHQLGDPADEELSDRTGILLEHGPPFLLVTHHPETRSDLTPAQQIAILLAALADSPYGMLFTLPNADAGGQAIATAIREFCQERPHAKLVDSLGSRIYFGAMRRAVAMVGNSSSGIIEAASFGLPVVNIGDRQKGRAHGGNVINAPLDVKQIRLSIERATAPEFRRNVSGVPNIYGDGKAAEKIVARLEQQVISASFKAKAFVDRV